MTAPRGKRVPALRPKDAASLIVMRRDADAVRFLMGRRSAKHVFMPGGVVFPGGRVDRADRFAPALDELDDAVEAKLLARSRADRARARSLALAAIREAFEETGVLIGRKADFDRPPRPPAWRVFLDCGVVPTLRPLRMVARAITPPGHARRFDARFFCVWADHIAAQLAPANDELEGVSWLSREETFSAPLPGITRLVLGALSDQLSRAPDLSTQQTVPFFRKLGGRNRVVML